MAWGDDEVIACGCGFDDVSFPHDCNQKGNKMNGQRKIVISGQLEKLKAMVIDYIDQGKKMERFQNEVLNLYAPQMKVPEERLNGFIQGLQVVLKMIATIEKGE